MSKKEKKINAIFEDGMLTGVEIGCTGHETCVFLAMILTGMNKTIRKEVLSTLLTFNEIEDANEYMKAFLLHEKKEKEAVKENILDMLNKL